MPHKDPEKAKEYFKQRYLRDREKLLARSKELYRANPEKKKEVARKWYADNKEYVAARGKVYREKTKERRKETQKKYQKNNKEAIAKKKATYAKNNKGLVQSIKARYRASKLQRTPSWSDTELIKDSYKEAAYFQMEVDHIIPLQGKLVSGLHVWDNLQLLSKEDNCKKGNSYEV